MPDWSQIVSQIYYCLDAGVCVTVELRHRQIIKLKVQLGKRTYR